WEIGIAHGVLRSARRRRAEFRGPPRPCTACWRSDKQADCGWMHATPLRLVRRSLALHLTVGRLRLHEVGSHEERGELCTQLIDRRLESLIEHITHHDHAAPHPLPLPTQFPVVELGHRAIAVHQGVEQGQYRISTDTIALGEFCDFLLSFRSKLLHTRHPLRSLKHCRWCSTSEDRHLYIIRRRIANPMSIEAVTAARGVAAA